MAASSPRNRFRFHWLHLYRQFYTHLAKLPYRQFTYRQVVKTAMSIDKGEEAKESQLTNDADFAQVICFLPPVQASSAT